MPGDWTYADKLDQSALLLDHEVMRSIKSLTDSLDKNSTEMKVQASSLDDVIKTIASVSEDESEKYKLYSSQSASFQSTLKGVYLTLRDIKKTADKEGASATAKGDTSRLVALDKIMSGVADVASSLDVYRKVGGEKARTSMSNLSPKINEQTHEKQASSKAYILNVKASVSPNSTEGQPALSNPGSAPSAGNEESSGGKSKWGTLYNLVDVAGKTISAVNASMTSFMASVGQAGAAIMSGFGNMLEDPMGAIISIMSGMAASISSAFSFLSSLLSSISGIISSFFGGSDSEEGSGKSSAAVAASLASAILKVISSIISIAVQAIQSGFNIFASTLTSIFKLFKKIALTSPILKAMLELLNLAFTLFFMPFMNSFALVLLPYVLELLDWAIETGQQFSDFFSLTGITNEELESILSSLLEQATALAVQFIKEFLPEILKLMPDLLDFAISFVNDIVKNKVLLLNFITQGLAAFKALMNAGLLEIFLQFGVDVMGWIKNNASNLVTTITAVFKAMLKIADFFMNFVGGSSSDSTTLSDTDFEAIDKLSESLSNLATTSTGSDAGDLNLNLTAAANGGKFPAYNGGIPVIAGEGGEGEYRLTDEELEGVGKDNTIVVQLTGDVMSKTDFQQVVRKNVTNVANKGYFR